MSDTEPPKLYLSTPPHFELSAFAEALPRILDAAEIACLRLGLASRDEDELARAGDVLREIAHARDIPVVIDNHYRLVDRLGLDGVHLTDGPRRVRDVRKALGKDAIVGAYCGTSRHDGMTAGEIGADYVSFGPVTASQTLDDGDEALPELFEWWSQMIEIPVVAEGGLTGAKIPLIAPLADFVCLSDEVWSAEDGPETALARIASQLG